MQMREVKSWLAPVGAQVAKPIIEAAGIPSLNTWNETVPLWAFHMKPGDCTHFCAGSAYEVGR